MVGTITVTLADSKESGRSSGFGDALCLLAAMFYALYSTLIRKKLPGEEAGEGKASTALFFGYLGLFNGILLAPVAILLHFTGLQTFHRLTLTQFGLIIGKGLLDNVLSDYLWAKAVLLTTPTAATAGLNIQIPIAAAVDSVRGKVPSPLSVVGALAVLVGFFGINAPATGCCGSSKKEEDVDDFDNVKPTTDLSAV
jgi:solute carrier family 35 protein F5